MYQRGLEGILMDTSPFYAGGTHLAWCAADAVIIPVRVDEHSLDSLDMTLDIAVQPQEGLPDVERARGRAPGTESGGGGDDDGRLQEPDAVDARPGVSHVVPSRPSTSTPRCSTVRTRRTRSSSPMTSSLGPHQRRQEHPHRRAQGRQLPHGGREAPAGERFCDPLPAGAGLPRQRPLDTIAKEIGSQATSKTTYAKYDVRPADAPVDQQWTA